MVRLVATLALTVWTLTVPPASAQPPQILFGADGGSGKSSNLYTLSPTTGAIASTIGPIGFGVTGLAVHPTTGVLYGSTANLSPSARGNLITIDRTTGQGTVVGPFGIPGQTMADLTFTSDGTLYGWLEGSADDLHTIDVTTGHATLVGDSGLSTFGSGLTANAANVIFFAGSGDDGALRTIDRTTGLPTTVATLTGTQGASVAALAFDATGVLFGVALLGGPEPASLTTINIATGEVTVLGDSVVGLDAIAFDAPVPVQAIPTLSDVAFVALPLLLAGGALSQIRRQRPGALRTRA
jgi:hypothetical protein